MILHPQLKQDCFVIGKFDLSLLLLLNDSQYPWFILVPQREDIKEIHHLTVAEQQQLMHESCLLAQALETTIKADKINVAALGNMVPQLHVHHIARFTTDPSWPKPVWGVLPAIPYTQSEVESVKQQIIGALPSLHSVAE